MIFRNLLILMSCLVCFSATALAAAPEIDMADTNPIYSDNDSGQNPLYEQSAKTGSASAKNNPAYKDNGLQGEMPMASAAVNPLYEADMLSMDNPLTEDPVLEE